VDSAVRNGKEKRSGSRKNGMDMIKEKLKTKKGY
jgi:hypothetical protein